jgi:hypothetical protein
VSTPLESLRQHLEFNVEFRQLSKPADWPYPFLCIEDLLLRCGSVFERSTVRPPVEPIPRACFYQCYRLTQRKSRWIYCEGYGHSAHGFPAHHAWVVRDDAPTLAVDLAWADGTPDDTAYIGIPFQRGFVREMHVASKRKQYSVLDTPWARYPLLTGKIQLEDVMWP